MCDESFHKNNNDILTDIDLLLSDSRPYHDSESDCADMFSYCIWGIMCGNIGHFPVASSDIYTGSFYGKKEKGGSLIL